MHLRLSGHSYTGNVGRGNDLILEVSFDQNARDDLSFYRFLEGQRSHHLWKSIFVMKP